MPSPVLIPKGAHVARRFVPVLPEHQLAFMTGETVVAAFLAHGNPGDMSELSIHVRHPDGQENYRPATWAEVRQFEAETPGWKGRVRPAGAS